MVQLQRLLMVPVAAVAAQAAAGKPAASIVIGPKSPAASNSRCTTSGATHRCVLVHSVPLLKLTPAQRTERAKVLGARFGATNALPRTRAPGAAVTILPPAQCDFMPLGGGITNFTANPDRFHSCADTLWTISNTVTIDGETTVSTFNFEDLQ